MRDKVNKTTSMMDKVNKTTDMGIRLIRRHA